MQHPDRPLGDAQGPRAAKADPSTPTPRGRGSRPRLGRADRPPFRAQADGTRLAQVTFMAAQSSLRQETSRPLSKTIALAYAIAGVALIALAVLLVRELMPHHAASVAKVVRNDPRVAPPAPAVSAPAAPATAPIAKGREETDAPHAATPAPKSDGLARARALASIIANPESQPTTGVFHNQVTHLDHYSYDDSFGPFRRGSMKRDAKNPAAWEIDGSNGPRSTTSLDEIAPANALHEAAAVRDANGNPVSTWFSVDSGPLAPSYATVLAAGGARVVSRAYLEENRSQFPAELTAVLDR